MIDINYSTIKTLLGLSLLIYEYDKKFKLEFNETLEDYLKKKEYQNLDIYLKYILYDLKINSLYGKVEIFINDKVSDIQVGITKNVNKKRFCLIFRGSESLIDWYYNILICKLNIGEGIEIHSGFYNILHTNDIYDKLKKKIDYLLDTNEDYELYITGHSLGAALATLFGYEYSLEKKNKNIKIITFASPKIGNDKFKEKFDKIENLVHYRFTTNKDIVTITPMFGYSHVGINICLYENKMKIYNEKQYNCYKDSLLYCNSVENHDYKLYYKRLLKNKW